MKRLLLKIICKFTHIFIFIFFSLLFRDFSVDICLDYMKSKVTNKIEQLNNFKDNIIEFLNNLSKRNCFILFIWEDGSPDYYILRKFFEDEILNHTKTSIIS
jgi:hypothetical protein